METATTNRFAPVADFVAGNFIGIIETDFDLACAILRYDGADFQVVHDGDGWILQGKPSWTSKYTTFESVRTFDKYDGKMTEDEAFTLLPVKWLSTIDITSARGDDHSFEDADSIEEFLSEIENESGYEDYREELQTALEQLKK